MKRIRILGISAALLLVAGSAGAQTTFFTNGVLRNQMWTSPDQSRVNIENGVAGTPNSDTIDLDIFQWPSSSFDNWGQRISGLFIPAVTTNYVFFCASDDDGDLFLSTDSSATNKRLIAQEATWDNFQTWTGSPQKRSDQWTNSAGVAPYKNGFPLVAGQKYWIEYIKHDGGGGDDAGATFKIVGEPDPVNGTPSLLTGSLIGYGLTFTAPITVKTDVQNATTLVGLPATFTFVPNNPSSDPLLANVLSYQWFRDGAAVPNATGQSYTIVPTATDSGAQFKVVATLDPQYNISLSVTSKVGTLTVNTGSLTYTNGLKLERFPGATLQTLEAGSVGAADLVTVSINGAEGPVNDGVNNYAHRMSGWYIPPADGNYVFFLSSDDDSDLFLSTDATSANKQLIAQENAWSATREWTNSSGGSVLSQKRSDQWTNGLAVAPFTAGIPLLKDHAYYIEADQHQGGGGDNLAILAQTVGQVDPTNGTPPIPANQLSLITKPTTSLTLTNLPHNTTVFEGGAPIFSAGATSDSEFTVLYQWQRNGTNIPGATSTSYSFTTVAADNGSTFDVVASTAEGGLSTNSATVTLTVQTAVFEQGLALMQYWLNKGADLSVPESGAFGPPDFVMAVPGFEAGVNNENGNTYVNEISGYFVPATSGAYDFIVTGDDHMDLFLSTDSNPNNKRLIAQEPGWSNALTWNTDNGGGSDMQQKNSSTWSNTATASVPFANGITLTAGQQYYMEVWHQEGGGGDSVAVTYVKHGGAIQADGTDSLISGAQLGFKAPNTATYVTFTNQPVSVTVSSGQTATFTGGGMSDGNLVIGTTGIFNTSGDVANVGAFKSFPNVLFQWYKNGTLIPGATTSSYTTPPLKPADSAQYYVGIRALGISTWSNSVTASLTVNADTTKPNAFAAEFDNNLIPTVSVSFDKTMDLASISDISHYSITGATITAILVNSNDARHVQLQLAAAPTTFPVSLTLTGITDFSGNAPVASTLSVAATELTNIDIGVASANDPPFPGFMWADNTNAYTIKCEGSDIWNADDGFNFSYETKTGDFDVVVRQLTFTKTSQWSKGGLMVREDLTSGSRDWNIVNDPTSADGIPAQDGNGNGANAVEANARLATGVASNTGWNTTPNPVPTYPNAWVRLKRVGQTLSGFVSSDGVTWAQHAYTDWSTNAVAMPATVYVGICCASHNNDAATADPPLHYYTASFANYGPFVASSIPSQATVSASISGGNIVISWTPSGGTLQSTTALGANATWSTVGTANPATIPLSGAAAKFFRVGP